MSAMLAQARQERERTRIEVEQLTCKLGRALRDLDAASAELGYRLREIEDLTRERDERTAEVDRRASAAVAARVELAAAQALAQERIVDVARVTAELSALAAQHGQVLASTSWRLTYPLRAFKHMLGAPFRRARATKGVGS